MRLLLINFEMDPASPVLAWQLSVALELARHCERLVVLTNRVGAFTRPANMTVYLFPKIFFRAPWRWLGGKSWLNLPVGYWCRRHAIQACFVHMNMEWCYRLAPVFRWLRIPVLLWYAHGTVTPELERAHRHATRVVTSTPEGFRLPSDKLAVIGQGVDATLFDLPARDPAASDILTIGRIAPRKQIDLALAVMEALTELAPDIPFRLLIIGSALTDADRAYQAELVQTAGRSAAADRIRFVGQVALNDLPVYYRTAFLHLNLSLTGSMDKTVMEALAAGCPVLTSNEAFRAVLRDFPDFLVNDSRPAAIARHILTLYHRRAEFDRAQLRALVVGRHDLATYGTRLMQELRTMTARARMLTRLRKGWQARRARLARYRAISSSAWRTALFFGLPAGLSRLYPRCRFKLGSLSFYARRSDLVAVEEIALRGEYDFLRAWPGAAPARLLDLGANIGLFALLAFNLFPGAEVWSVEASPDTARVLQANQRLNPGLRWHIASEAVWKTDGWIEFEAAGASTTRRIAALGARTASQAVRAVSFTRLVDRCGGRIELCKMDIEGAEAAVLEAGGAALEHIDQLLIEIHPALCPAEQVRQRLRAEFDHLYRVAQRDDSSKPLVLASRRPWAGPADFLQPWSPNA